MNAAVNTALFGQGKQLMNEAQILAVIKESEVVTGISGSFFIVKDHGGKTPRAVKLATENGFLVADGVALFRMEDVEVVATL